jgi:hypothetical protein
MRSSVLLAALAAFGVALSLDRAMAAPLQYEPKKLEIEIPLELQGVRPDPSAKLRSDHFKYEILGQLYPLGERHSLETKDPVELRSTNAWSLVRQYLKIIAGGKRTELQPLMSAEAWSTFSKITPEGFAARAAPFQKMKQFTPLFGLDYKGVVLLHWLNGDGKIDLLPLARKPDGTYQIHPFHAGQDPTLGNLFQYALHRPQPPSTPRLTQKFSTWSPTAERVALECELARPGNSLILYRENLADPKGEPRLLGIARDGGSEQGFLRFSDLDKKPARLRLEIKTSELRSDQPYQLFALELNYPPSGVPKAGRQNAQSWLVTPPKGQ